MAAFRRIKIRATVETPGMLLADDQIDRAVAEFRDKLTGLDLSVLSLKPIEPRPTELYAPCGGAVVDDVDATRELSRRELRQRAVADRETARQSYTNRLLRLLSTPALRRSLVVFMSGAALHRARRHLLGRHNAQSRKINRLSPPDAVLAKDR